MEFYHASEKEEALPIDASSIKLSETVDVYTLFRYIFRYIEACRYLAAYEIFQEIQRYFNYPVNETKDQINIEREHAFVRLPRIQQIIAEKGYNEEKLLQLPTRVQDVHDAVRYQDDNSEWTLGADLFGVQTYYRLDDTDNSIIVKLEGHLNDLPIFELLAVLKEVDLFSEFLPFCKESAIVERIGHAELISYVWLSTPLMGRDFCFRAYAADCMFEHGRVIIAGKSVDETSSPPPANPIPWKKKGWLQDRMIMKEMKSIINVIDPKCAQNIFIIHVDPNTRLPQTILNFVMRNLAGVLLYLLSRQAVKASQDPNCSHAHRIREDTEFYRDWLLPKLSAYCEFKGWEQPAIESLGRPAQSPSEKATK